MDMNLQYFLTRHHLYCAFAKLCVFIHEWSTSRQDVVKVPPTGLSVLDDGVRGAVIMYHRLRFDTAPLRAGTPFSTATAAIVKGLFD